MFGWVGLLLMLSQHPSCADPATARDAEGGEIQVGISQDGIGRPWFEGRVLAKCEHEDEILDQVRKLRGDVRRLTALVERMDLER